MNSIVNWRDLESDLRDIERLYGVRMPNRSRPLDIPRRGETVQARPVIDWEDLAKRLADRINDRHYQASKKLFDTIQEYRELRREKFINNAR